MEKKKERIKVITYLMLQLSFLIYAFSSFFSKFSTYGDKDLKSTCFYYLLSLICLGIYAIVWQQVLKRMSLSVAFSNKGITLLWGLLFGAIFLKESITIGKIIGILIIIIGIVILMNDKNKKAGDKND